MCAGEQTGSSPEGAGGDDAALDKVHVLAFHKQDSRGRPNKTVHHAANHSFCKAFLVKHFPRSELVRQHMTETLQVAGCAEAGVLGLAAATVQRNVELANNPEQQAASLGGTGVTLEEANAPPTLSGQVTNGTTTSAVVTHTPVAAIDRTLAMIDRMDRGPERSALLMREYERESKLEDERRVVAFDATLMERKAREERRIVVHNQEVARIQDDRNYLRKESEARMTKMNSEIKNTEIATLTAKRDACMDAGERAVIQGKLSYWDAIPSTQTYTVDQRTTQAPVPLAQAVIATNNGSIADIRLPSNVAIIHIDTQRYLTLQEFMPLWWREDPLEASLLLTLGREVAKAHDQLVAGGQAVRNTSLARGVAQAPRAYSLFELTQPPLHSVIEKFVFALREAGPAGPRGRKRKADAASTPSMRDFVVTGTPLAF